MSLKIGFCILGSALVLSSSSAFAYKDYCTPKLNKYLESVQSTVDNKYLPDRQKAVAQKILDRVKDSRNDTKDCVLLDKFLP